MKEPIKYNRRFIIRAEESGSELCILMVEKEKSHFTKKQKEKIIELIETSLNEEHNVEWSIMTYLEVRE